ncbi:hypothetical protein QVD99_003355 [Batrachochytrium dendrobatidis]|nr:hypothetical protein QVD99_003355 [Batrachochytrium dendrobatidis]
MNRSTGRGAKGICGEPFHSIPRGSREVAMLRLDLPTKGGGSLSSLERGVPPPEPSLSSGLYILTSPWKYEVGD